MIVPTPALEQTSPVMLFISLVKSMKTNQGNRGRGEEGCKKKGNYFVVVQYRERGKMH